MSEFNDLLLAEWKRLDRTDPEQVTVWDAFVSLVGNFEDAYILALKADMVIIKHLVEGYSVRTAARILGIPAKNIHKVIRIWGLKEPPDETLDFNPLLVYNEGMSELDFETEIELFLPIVPTKDAIHRIIWNIERYADLREFLEEVELV
jgi:hypothetical protein